MKRRKKISLWRRAWLAMQYANPFLWYRQYRWNHDPSTSYMSRDLSGEAVTFTPKGYEQACQMTRVALEEVR